jgi:DMSO reductase anchor subunit
MADIYLSHQTIRTMKTIYTLLILLLTVTFANAQSNEASVEALTNNTVTVSEVNDDITTNVNTTNEVNENEVLLIDAKQVKESVARSASNIRIYLNRERNLDNISLLFPNINKAKSA